MESVENVPPEEAENRPPQPQERQPTLLPPAGAGGEQQIAVRPFENPYMMAGTQETVAQQQLVGVQMPTETSRELFANAAGSQQLGMHGREMTSVVSASDQGLVIRSAQEIVVNMTEEQRRQLFNPEGQMNANMVAEIMRKAVEMNPRMDPQTAMLQNATSQALGGASEEDVNGIISLEQASQYFEDQMSTNMVAASQNPLQILPAPDRMKVLQKALSDLWVKQKQLPSVLAGREKVPDLPSPQQLAVVQANMQEWDAKVDGIFKMEHERFQQFQAQTEELLEIVRGRFVSALTHERSQAEHNVRATFIAGSQMLIEKESQLNDLRDHLNARIEKEGAERKEEYQRMAAEILKLQEERMNLIKEGKQRIGNLELDLNNEVANRKSLEEQLQKAKQEKGEQERQRMKLEKKLKIAEGEGERDRIRKLELEGAIQRKGEEVGYLRDQVNQGRDEKVKLEAELESAKKDLSAANARIEGMIKQHFGEKAADFATFQAEFTSEQAKLRGEITRLEKQLQDLQSQTGATDTERRGQIRSLEGELQNAKDELERGKETAKQIDTQRFGEEAAAKQELGAERSRHQQTIADLERRLQELAEAQTRPVRMEEGKQEEEEAELPGIDVTALTGKTKISPDKLEGLLEELKEIKTKQRVAAGKPGEVTERVVRAFIEQNHAQEQAAAAILDAEKADYGDFDVEVGGGGVADGNPMQKAWRMVAKKRRKEYDAELRKMMSQRGFCKRVLPWVRKHHSEPMAQKIIEFCRQKKKSPVRKKTSSNLKKLDSLLSAEE